MYPVNEHSIFLLNLLNPPQMQSNIFELLVFFTTKIYFSTYACIWTRILCLASLLLFPLKISFFCARRWHIPVTLRKTCTSYVENEAIVNTTDISFFCKYYF